MSDGFVFQELLDYEVDATEGFVPWLLEQRVALAFTQAQRVWTIGAGTDDGPRPAITVQTFPQPLGIVADGSDTIWLATRFQIWRLQNVLGRGDRTHKGRDRLYVPRTGYTTGFLGAQDLATRSPGPVVFTNSLFNCVAEISNELSFEPIWIPPFVTEFVGEDRCHLSGVALRADEPAFVTVFGVSDTARGWLETSYRDGAVVSVTTDDVLARGLCMPFSPRIFDGRVWLAVAGSGEFGYVDADAARFEPVIRLPAFLRGVAIVGHHAVVAASGSRTGDLFSGLPVEEAVLAAGGRWRQGLYVIDLCRGEVTDELSIIGAANEIHALTAVPGTLSPRIVGPHSDEARSSVAVGTTIATSEDRNGVSSSATRRWS